MIGPMDPQFPAGISVFALMWAVPYLVCVWAGLLLLCVWQGWGERVQTSPLFTLAVFRCGAWPRVCHKPADSGTNTAVKHQSWQLMQTLLITAGSFRRVCVCVCIPSCECTLFVFRFLTSHSVFCQVQVADLEKKIKSGSINNIFGTRKSIECLQNCKSLLQWDRPTTTTSCSTCINVHI